MHHGYLRKTFFIVIWIAVYFILISTSNYFLNKNLYYQSYDLKALIISNLSVLLLLTMLASWSKSRSNRLIKYTVIGLITAFIFIAATEMVTVKFANQGFTSMTFMHFEPHAISIAFFSHPWAFLGLISLIVLLTYAIYQMAHNKTYRWQLPVFFVALFFSVWFANGSSIGRLSTNLYKYYQAQFISTKSVESIHGLSSFGINPISIRRNAISAEFKDAPKNLIIIYLESFSHFFTDHPDYPELTPNLNQLAQRYGQFENYNSAARFTMEGVISSQCGVMPHIEFGNDIVMDESPFEMLPCLSDILDQLDYHQEFIGGARKSFSNKEVFLKMKGYDRVWGWEDFENEPGIQKNGWGLNDDQLFAFALNRALHLKETGRPFHLDILNLATHLNGYPAPECTPYNQGVQSHPFLDGIHCVDQLIGHFLQQLQEQGVLDETVVYITADHGVYAVELIKELFGPNLDHHRLFGMLIKPNTTTNTAQKSVALYDAAPILVDALDIETNVSFINGLPLDQIQDDRYLLLPKQLVSKFAHVNTYDCDHQSDITHPLSACEHHALIKKNQGFVQLFRKKNMLMEIEPMDYSLETIEVSATHQPGQYAEFKVNSESQAHLFSYIGHPVEHKHKRFRNHLYVWIYDLENEVTIQRRAFMLNPSLNTSLETGLVNLLTNINSDYLAVFFTEGSQKVDNTDAWSSLFAEHGFDDFNPPHQPFLAAMVSQNQQYKLKVWPLQEDQSHTIRTTLNSQQIGQIISSTGKDALTAQTNR